MILTCPACATSYQVSDEAFGHRARKVRCKKCAHEWVNAPEQLIPSAPTSALVADEAERIAPPEPRLSAASATLDGAVSTITRTPIGTGLTKPHGRRPAMPDRLLSLGLALVIMAGLVFAIWLFRTGIVQAWPAAAGLYSAVGVPVNALGIEIRHPAWQIAQQDGTPVLTVQGEITNITGRGLAVPPLQLALRDDKARELYHWSVVLDSKRLNPGETARFTTSLPNPPLEAHDVQIRFQSGA